MSIEALFGHSMVITLGMIAATITSIGIIWTKAVKPAAKSVIGWVRLISRAAARTEQVLSEEGVKNLLAAINALFPPGSEPLSDVVLKIREQQVRGDEQRKNDHLENATRLEEIEKNISDIHERVETIEIRQEYASKVMEVLPTVFPEEVQVKLSVVMQEHLPKRRVTDA